MSNVKATVLTVVSLAFATCLGGCEDDSFSPGKYQEPLKGAYLNDQIVLDASGLVNGVVTHDEITFDLGGLPMVRDGTFNDFEISYWTGSSCDQDSWVYNYNSESWDQIGFDNAPDVGCWATPREHFHLLSAAGIDARDVLGRHNRLRLRVYYPPDRLAAQQEFLGGRGSPTVRALRINPDYLALSLVGSEPRHCYGLTFDGEALWASERGKLLRLARRAGVQRKKSAGCRHLGLPFNSHLGRLRAWRMDSPHSARGRIGV
jgi:hypothetical protein